MTEEEAVILLARTDTPLSQRLEAHAVLLRGAKNITPGTLAVALADICIALTRIGAR